MVINKSSPSVGVSLQITDQELTMLFNAIQCKSMSHSQNIGVFFNPLLHFFHILYIPRAFFSELHFLVSVHQPLELGFEQTQHLGPVT